MKVSYGFRPDSQSYKYNDVTWRRKNMGDFNPRSFDYGAPITRDFDQKMEEATGKILGIYSSAQGDTYSRANRYAMDTVMAIALNKDINEVEKNHDLYMRMFTGKDLDEKSFVEAFSDSWNTYGVTKDIADLMNQYDDTEDEREKLRLDREMRKLEDELAKLQDYSDRGWLQNTAIKSAPILNQVVRTAAWTVAGSLAGAGIGALSMGAGGTLQGVNLATKARTAFNLLRAQKGAMRAGRFAGNAINAIKNVYGVERGSFSRELYSLTDSNGNRLSDNQRNIWARNYGIMSTLLEFFTPEPGLGKWGLGLGDDLELIVRGSVKKTAMKFLGRNIEGAFSEATEEALQSMTGEMIKDLAMTLSNSSDETAFEESPEGQKIYSYLKSAYDSFTETFFPSLIAGGIVGGAMDIGAYSTSDLITRTGILDRPSTDEVETSRTIQKTSDKSKDIKTKYLKIEPGTSKREQQENQKKAAKETADTQNSEPELIEPIKVREDERTNKYVPINEEEMDKAKYLRDKDAKSIAIEIQGQSQSVISEDDFQNAVYVNNGLYDSETHTAYVSSVEEADALINNTLNDVIVDSQMAEDGSYSVRYRNLDGNEETVRIVVDPDTINAVSSATDESSFDTVEQTANAQNADTRTVSSNVEMDSWQSRGAEWFNTREFTASVANLVRSNPDNAKNIVSRGISAYIQKAISGISVEQADAIGNANASLISRLAAIQGREVADFIEGISGFGTTSDSVKGQYRAENGERYILLNPEKMSPTTLSHEIAHYFLNTLKDGNILNAIRKAFSRQIKADGDKIGTKTQEAFANGLTSYITTGEAQNQEIRSVYQKLLDAMKDFVGRMNKAVQLTAKQKALYDEFFRGDLDSLILNEDVSDSDVILNEAVDEDSIDPATAELRKRLWRGRATQAMRKRRFMDNIGRMIDAGVYVDTQELDAWKVSLYEKLTDAVKNLKSQNLSNSEIENNSEVRKLRDDLLKYYQEVKDRDAMYKIPKEQRRTVLDGISKEEFINNARNAAKENGLKITAEEERILGKFYDYANTRSAITAVDSFVAQYNSLPKLLSLKAILGPRRVASTSRSGSVYTRVFMPTSNVWSEIENLTRNSTTSEVQAVLDSIKTNRNEWYQAYLSALISGARLNKTQRVSEYEDLEAIALSYYAGRANNGNGAEYGINSLLRPAEEKVRKDISDARSNITANSKNNGPAIPRNIRRADTFSDEYIRKMLPKLVETIGLEKARAKAKETFAKAERAIRRMSNVNTATTDASVIPATRWIYAFMHGGRNTAFEQISTMTDADRNTYQNILEGLESSDNATYDLYPTDMVEGPDGELYYPDRYGDIYQAGFTANLGGYVFEKNNIPEELRRFLPEETVEHIKTAEEWNDLTAEDVTNIADALRMAKQNAQDLYTERKRQRLASNKRKAMDITSRLLSKAMNFQPEQLKAVGEELKLGRDATPEEVMDFYRQNPSRAFDHAEQYIFKDKKDRLKGTAKEGAKAGYLSFMKMSRVARLLDGVDNGPIFNTFYREIFESYQDYRRETLRRSREALDALAPIAGRQHGTKEEEARYKAFAEKLNNAYTLRRQTTLPGERATMQVKGFDLLMIYLQAGNRNGFEKLIDPNNGSAIALEELVKYVPQFVVKFVKVELALRESALNQRQEILNRRNNAEDKKAKADDTYEPQYADVPSSFEELSDNDKSKSFINGDTAYLERILAQAEGATSQLDPDFIKAGDILLSQLSKETGRVVDATYRIKNQLMQIEDRYFPLIDSNRSIGSGFDRLWNNMGGRKATPGSGMTVSRQRTQYDILGVNPLAVFFGAIEAQERFINMGETARNIDNIWDVHGGNVGEAIEVRFGKKFANYFHNYMVRMSGNDEVSPMLGMGIASKALSALQSSMIALSPLTYVRQYVSLIASATSGTVSQKKIANTLYRYATDSTYRQEVSERIQHLAPELAETEFNLEIAAQRRLEQMTFDSDVTKAKFRDFMTSWVRNGDMVTKYVAWQAAYEASISKGMTEADAAFTASNLVQETMSVTDPSARSELQTQNVFARWFFLFSTDTFNTWNILFGDMVADLKQGDKARALKRLGGVIAMSAALALIQGGWLPDDDDDDWFDESSFFRDFLTENIRSFLPILGLVVDDIASPYGNNIPIISDVFNAGKKLINPEKSVGEKIDGVIDAMNSAAALTGWWPSTTAERVVNTVYTPQGGFFLNPFALLNADYANWWKGLFD